MNARNAIVLTAALLISIAIAVQAAPPKPKLYKWVDENGVVHYGSTIPPQYAKQQVETLNKEGIVVDTHAAQKTPEQIAAEQQAKAQADQQAQQAAAQKAHDKVLLDTYTSVGDMERDRDNKLAAIDAQINVISGTINGLQSNLADLQGRASELTGNGKPVPDSLQKQIDDTRQQLVTNNQLLFQQQQHKQEVSDQFTADIARFKELTAPAPTTPGG